MSELTFAELKKRFARSLKNTARFYRVDLHVHSSVSHDCEVPPADMVVAGCKAGLSMIAVTDHNRADNVPAFRTAADKIRREGANLYENNNLLVLPGIEITVEESNKTVHVMGIFPENTDWSQIERVLDDTGVEPNKEVRNKLSKVSRKRLVEIVERIHGQKGLAIFAHVNTENGYRFEMLKAGKNHDDILKKIVEWNVNGVEISKKDDKGYFDYQKKQIPCMINSDAHLVSEIGAKEHITRVKMTKPSFIDLSRALKDPQTRIRFEDMDPTGFKRILGIEFSGGFFDGQTIGFSPDLNCLIGGRGTGKSTLIEAIRYIFDYQIPSERVNDIEDMRRQVFKDCTITLIFEDNYGTEYVLKRAYGELQTSIMNLSGEEQEDIDLDRSQHMRVSIFGWSEIERIAKDPSHQLDLIDSYIDDVSRLKQSEQATLQELKTNATVIANELRCIKTEENHVGNLSEIELQLKNIGEEETQEEINKAKAEKEAAIVEMIKTTFGVLSENIGDIQLRAQLTDIYTKIKEEEKRDSFMSSQSLKDVVGLLSNALKESGSIAIVEGIVKKTITDLYAEIKGKLDVVDSEHKDITTKYNKLLQRLDQTEYSKLAQERQRLRGEIAVRKKAQGCLHESQEKLRNLQVKRERLVESLVEARGSLHEVRDQHVEKITKLLPRGKENLDIELRVEKQKNRDCFIKLLNEKLTKLPERWRRRKFPETIAENFTPVQFASVIRNRDIKLLEQVGFTNEESGNIVKHFQEQERQEDVMEFESCECADLPRILFNVEGEKKLIEHLSPGQRCTALLPIILLETDTPLIIDQPEDNLDNQYIFDLVVTTLRDLKERRQIVVATHNPNIPVSGDAENIIVFKAEGANGKVKISGSIDYQPVIKEVKSIMEGGDEAFSIRVQKYGI